MTDITDEEIAGLVQRGDLASFSLLMQRYEQKFIRYGRKFLSDATDIEDIVQEIFIKVYVNIKSFDLSKRFSPWAYRIAHNEFVNALKKRKSSRIFAFDLDVLFPQPVSRETADRGANNGDLRRMLDASMDKISAKYREPLVLYYFEELNYREIAEIMQIPVATVGVRLGRGKALLKKILSENNYKHGI